MKFFRFLVPVCLILLLFPIFVKPIFSQESNDLDNKKKEIEAIQQELNRLQGEKQTLSTTIKFFDNKIKLTEAQIKQTEQELDQVNQDIIRLTGEIIRLDSSLEELTAQLVHRINQSYKESRVSPYLSFLVSNHLNQLINRMKYLQVTEKHHRNLIYQLETTRTDFDHQKTLKEEKQQQLNTLTEKLESQKKSLASQQKSKQQLLEMTKNDERRFQQELKQKLAELEAIQSIIAGKGDEKEVGNVEEGNTIASIIPGPSACSSGAHLHFEVIKDNNHRNPADLLSPKSVTWDNSPDSPFNFSGSWRWPLDDPIRITQGYGMTFYASVVRYYGGNPHTGIDMINSDLKVKSVKKGKLLRGAIACGGGTLRYVKVQQEDGIDTYYLHINY